MLTVILNNVRILESGFITMFKFVWFSRFVHGFSRFYFLVSESELLSPELEISAELPRSADEGSFVHGFIFNVEKKTYLTMTSTGKMLKGATAV